MIVAVEERNRVGAILPLFDRLRESAFVHDVVAEIEAPHRSETLEGASVRIDRVGLHFEWDDDPLHLRARRAATIGRGSNGSDGGALRLHQEKIVSRLHFSTSLKMGAHLQFGSDG